MQFTPKQIVSELDKYIIGQAKAKRAVAIALRNRYRRSKLSKELREEITPKNIIMRGPTGVGKTEIARRLAKLVKAPFIKVEATKYTEVGYVGRDVESMVRDLVEMSVRMVKDEKQHEVEAKVAPIVTSKLVDALYEAKQSENQPADKQQLREQLLQGALEEEMVSVSVVEQPKPIMAIGGPEINLGSMFDGLLPQRRKHKKMSVARARELLMSEESDKLIDLDNISSEAIRRAEEEGIIFIDEIDKIIGVSNNNSQDVSREGVQRDILPIVEGCTVATKYGNIKTDFILFIASGAFHVSKIEDMIPELQGRFPIRVDLDSLTEKDFNNSGEKVTYHASCHICRGLGVTKAPRDLIADAATYVPCAEEDVCCGFGGTYSMKFPEISGTLLAKKLKHIEETGASRVVMDCPGCVMQLRGGVEKQGMKVKVSHIAELVAENLKH